MSAVSEQRQSGGPAREIVIAALDGFTPGFLAQGMWAHPRDRTVQLNSLEYWTDYARLLEKGLFDFIFFADTIGVYDAWQGSRDQAVRYGVQFPINDPWTLVSGMAAVTRNLGIAATGNVLYEPPYLFARRLSTLDHLTGGRVGWNIVTGILASAARAQGRSMPGHDQRYDMADDFMEVVYRLWEKSWDDDAVLRDRASLTYADPAKVHDQVWRGEHFTLDGVHLCEPSPQRTPVLFQAGSSGRGMQFAARHAEGMFVNGTSAQAIRKAVDGIHQAVVAQGRRREDVRVLAGLTVIVGRTEQEARDKHRAFKAAASTEAALVHAAGGMGVDLSRYPLDGAIEFSEVDANRTLMENLTRRGGRSWSVREVGEEMSLSGRNALIVGDPAQVADAMIELVEASGIDGFNLARVLMPDSFAEFIELVVPVLQERGVYKTAYRPGTLREKLGLGEGPRLAASHYGRQIG